MTVQDLINSREHRTLGWIGGRLSLPYHQTLGVLRFMEYMQHMVQTRTGFGLHFHEADPALIVIHPAHDRLFNLHRQKLVREPQFQLQTRPAREGRRAFNPTPLQREIQEHRLSISPGVSITHGPPHRHTSTTTLGDHRAPFGKEPPSRRHHRGGAFQPYQQEVRRQDLMTSCSRNRNAKCLTTGGTRPWE